MPKQVLNINDFSGGLDESSDPRDIQDNQFATLTGVNLTQHGIMKFIGGEPTIETRDKANSGRVDAGDGSGTHVYSTDNNTAGEQVPTEWLVYYSNSNFKLELYNPDNVQEITLVDDWTPRFYDADGYLRISDADFGNDTKWHGYIDTDLYRVSATGAYGHSRGEWVTTTQALKPFDNGSDDDLGVTLALDDMSAGNPDSTALGTAINKIVLGYNKYSKNRGKWNGVYEFGLTAIYLGNQEGPISKIPGAVETYKHKMSFQLYICAGTTNITSAPYTTNNNHLLGDDRIIGVNAYYRTHGTNTWLLLKKFDLILGEPHYWLAYDSDDEALGIWVGTFTVAEPVSVVEYADTTCVVSYDLNADILDDDRSGYIRLFGFLASPMLLEVPAGTISGQFSYEDPQTFTFNVINPSKGQKDIYAQVLDEEFNVVKESVKRPVDFGGSSTPTPPSFDGTAFNEETDPDIADWGNG